MEKAEVQANPNLRPVLIKQGVLGAERSLLVSPQHGMLFGRSGDHLHRAKHLATTTPGIRIAHGKRPVTYIHLMFEVHQIIFAENTRSEGFYPGQMAPKMMGAEQRSELSYLFPEMNGAIKAPHLKAAIVGTTAREFLTKKQLLH